LRLSSAESIWPWINPFLQDRGRDGMLNILFGGKSEVETGHRRDDTAEHAYEEADRGKYLHQVNTRGLRCAQTPGVYRPLH
jgi:hypothetical protein